jgi:hypothetical protein
VKGTVPILLAMTLLASSIHAADDIPLFHESFDDWPGDLPGDPWKEETYKSGAIIKIDDKHVFSGTKALHIHNPRGAKYRRGYLAIHVSRPLPQLNSGLYGAAMVWLDAAPIPLPGEPPVHWTLLQGEGRSADDRYNSIYRLGVEGTDGLGLMANFETTPPVTTDCKQKTTVKLPVKRWACVEWHFEVATQELEFWLDGVRVTHIRGRGDASASCKGNDLAGEWKAPPKFDSFYIGFERYADSANDQDLWIDSVVLEKERVGCPATK